jgi:hypothetical protein
MEKIKSMDITYDWAKSQDTNLNYTLNSQEKTTVKLEILYVRRPTAEPFFPIPLSKRFILGKC